jgi:hypothetical protein
LLGPTRTVAGNRTEWKRSGLGLPHDSWDTPSCADLVRLRGNGAIATQAAA